MHMTYAAGEDELQGYRVCKFRYKLMMIAEGKERAH